MDSNFYLIDKRSLPDVYEKVVKAKRSVYYKYKDYVFDFSESPKGRKATFNIMIIDEKGVLSNILNNVSNLGGNILTINQGIPLNGYEYISITIDMSSVKGDIKTLSEEIEKVDRVEKVEFIAME